MSQPLTPNAQHFATQLAEARSLLAREQWRAAERLLGELKERNPHQVDVFLLLARAKESRGILTEQIQCLEQAGELDSHRAEIHIRLAYAHLNSGDFPQATHSADVTIECADVSAEDLHGAAKVYHATGLHKRSARVIERAIALGADSDRVYYDYGMALTLSGDVEAASNAYRECLRRNPESGMAYAGLSKVRKATLEDNHVETLGTLVKTQRNPWIAINIYHSLAKELDDLGRYGEAFRSLQKGKRRLRPLCPHTPAAAAQNVAALRQLYQLHGQDISASQPSQLLPDGQPIFVVGMPRSGTTVVERILTNHNDVESIGERLQFSMALKAQCSQHHSSLADAGILARNWPDIDFRRAGSDYLASVRYLRTDSTRFVDKLPLNILLSGAILRALPHARIVCLLRNPTDTLLGNYRQVFEYNSGTYVYTLDLLSCARFIIEFRALAQWLAAQFPNRFILVDYEKLVAEPETQARRLLDACFLSWDPACLDIHKNRAAIGTASAAQVKEPIHQRAVGHARYYARWLEEAAALFEPPVDKRGRQ